MKTINNAIYSELGSRWYQADDDPVALLRAESRLRNPWVRKQIAQSLNGLSSSEGACLDVLDIGCGAGFLSNELAKDRNRVVGVDLSESSLAVAAAYDTLKAVQYLKADATELPFPDKTFDAVCSMDLLEHTEFPEKVVSEASRVLRPGGRFFFYTFNRNFISWFLAIKVLEWFVKNTPKNLHVYHLFIKPRELAQMCVNSGLQIEGTIGIKPVLFTKATLDLLLTGKVSRDFRFEFTSMKVCGYLCFGRKL